MEREYIAFISYRHLPLEMATAKKLHKRIEHYLIPKDLRKDGRKKLGYVFRDQDELPISSNLNDNIEQALDKSEFLIVICTPETVKSKWVLGEISYFLQHHPRERVLAVLADGVPATAFPPQLTTKCTPEGDFPNQIEPLAANIVADSAAKRARLFRTESLRILAALIGCPFDALYRREVRYQRRRALTLAGVGITIAAVFIGMLLNRNAEIQAQLRQTQINESLALASLSKEAYEDGDYQEALSLALKALPEEGERPYVARAEEALADALKPYINGKLNYIQSIRQDTTIIAAVFSADGEKLATLDNNGVVRFYLCDTGELLWEAETDKGVVLLYLDDVPAVLVTGLEGTAVFEAERGTLLWEKKELTGFDLPALSPDQKTVLTTYYISPEEPDAEEFSLLDIRTGKPTGSFRLSEASPRYCAAAALSDDGAYAALLLQRNGESVADLLLCSLKDGSVDVLIKDLRYSPGLAAYRLAFTQQGDLALASDDMAGESAFRLFDRENGWELRFETPIETEQIAQVVYNSLTSLSSVDVFACWDNCAAVGSKHLLHMISLDTGEVCWSRTLPGTILSAIAYEDRCLSLALSDGTISFCSDTGVLTYTQGIYSFEGGFPVFLAAGSGSSYLESSFALVPNETRSEVSIIRFRHPEWMIQVAAFSGDVSHVSLVSSPTGRLVACVGYNAIDVPVEWVLLDTVEGSSSEIREIPADSGWKNPADLCLSEQGELTATKELSSAEGAVLTRNSGEELIISYTEDGTVSVVRSADKALLYSEKQTRLEAQLFNTKPLITAAESAKGDRLLLFFDSLSFSEPLCVVLDTESWGCSGVFSGPAAYIPGRDSVLISSYLDGVYICPFWNCRELMDMAKAVIG